MRFIDLFHKGYVLIDITRERLQGEFWHLATITERRREERLAAATSRPGATTISRQRAAPAPPERSGNPLPRQGWAAGSNPRKQNIGAGTGEVRI